MYGNMEILLLFQIYTLVPPRVEGFVEGISLPGVQINYNRNPLIYISQWTATSGLKLERLRLVLP